MNYASFGDAVNRTNALIAIFYSFLFALMVWLNLSLIGYVDDDAYIHFRIAENLLLHGQPYFNPGEPIMASSSSGWTITLYTIFSVFGMNLKAVSVFNALITSLNVFVYARLAGELTGRKGPSNDLLAALAVVPVLSPSSAGLMETPLAMLVLGLGLLLYQRNKPYSFIFLASCVFLRPELTVFSLVFLAYALYTGIIPVRKMLVYGIAGASPFLIYNHFFFGTNIPHTVIAKKAVYALEYSRTFCTLLPSIGTLSDPGIRGSVIELMLIVLLSATAAAGISRGVKGKGRTAVLMIVSGFAVIALYTINNVFLFMWYKPLYVLPIFFPLFVYARQRRTMVYAAVLAVAFAPYMLDFADSTHDALKGPSSFAWFEDGARTRKYLDVGGRLKAAYPDSTLMSAEIGALGYSFKGYVYDACGLASDAALKYHPMKVPDERADGVTGAIPPGFVRETRPDIIVSYEKFDRALVKSGLLGEYVRVEQDAFLPEDTARSDGQGYWGSQELDVFIRRDKYKGAF